MGGEITYRCLGDSTYEVTLSVYRDCFNGEPPFDATGWIGVFDSAWNLVGNLTPKYVAGKDDTLSIILSNPCLVAPPDVCVHRFFYRSTVTLPFKKGGYTFVYQRCCRNTLIRNIILPLDVGASYTAQISEDALRECNTSAVYNSWPPVAICIHQPIDFDHGAVDADGDSLVYRLCTPLNGASPLPNLSMPQPPNPGPYLEIPWQDPPYNLTNLLGGDPLKINPKTGFMTGVPNTIGNFVVGVCVDEYRDDQIISTTRRDFQFNVSDCGAPVAAFFAPEVVCNTLTVIFKNQSLGEKTSLWYFDWENNKSLSSNSFSPTYTYPDTGSYTIALIINKDDQCHDTTFQTIYLTRSFANAALDIQFPDCDSVGLTVQAIDLSTDPNADIAAWKWTLAGPGSFLNTSVTQNPQFTVKTPGKYVLTLITTSENGCMDTVVQQFNAPIPNVSPFPLVRTICQGDSIALWPAAPTGFQYAWTPAWSLSDSTALNPLAFPDTTTTYTATLSGNGPCVREQQVTVNVFEPLALTAIATPDTIFKGQTSQLQALTGAPSLSWQPAGSLSNPLIANPVAKPSETTDYEVRALIGGGCELVGTVRVVVLTPECIEPYIFFPTGFSPNNDGENDALKLEGNLVEEVYWVVYNRWGEKVFEADDVDDAWDGTFRGQPQPAETYGYYLRVRCIGGEQSEKKGNVTLLR